MPIDRNSAQYITGAIYKPTQTSAPGVWDLDDQANNISKNLWPLPPQAIRRSLRFNPPDNPYILRSSIPTGTSSQKFTYSVWVKRSKFGSRQLVLIMGNTAGSDATSYSFEFTSADVLSINNQGSSIVTNAVYRDPSAWLHIVIAYDTTQATSSDRTKVWVNGIQVSSFSSAAYPTQNNAAANLSGHQQSLGDPFNQQRTIDGYVSEAIGIDGQALDATSFGETDQQTGVWIPKRYTGTYGTNGFRLSFANNSSTTALGYDSSGQGNNWTANNFSVTPGTGNDSLLDVPSLYGTDTGLGGEVLGNYCTWNPLDKDTNVTLANGNLDLTAYNQGVYATWSLTSGKWYYELTLIDPYNGGGSINFWGYHGLIGVQRSAAGLNVSSFSGIYCNTDTADNNAPGIYQLGTRILAYTTFANSDIIGLAADIDNKTLTIYRNGTVIRSNITLANISTFYIWSGMNGTSGDPGTTSVNFGQRPFAYPAPSGFKALCTTNLPAPAIGQTSSNQADNHFNVVTYSGNGSTQNLTTDFAPDLVWIKNRTTNYSHMLYDTLRGPSTGSVSKVISSNATDIEGTVNDNSTYGYLSSFNANGFTVTAGSFTGSGGYTNTSGQNYVAWCWNAGGTSVTNGAGTNGATIASTYRANRAAGFSIVTYTGNGVDGATVAHGLGIAPAFIIVKSRNNTYNWGVWHKNLAKYDANHTYALGLNLTRIADATAQYAVFYPGLNNTNVFGLGNESTSNQLNSTYIAYCFAEVSGYSAFGIFSHAALADGTFVNTGFRPRFLLLKGTDNASNWIIHDAVCDPVNFVGRGINANLSGAESTSNSLYSLDFVSNGFKMRNTGLNGNFIYMAIAETPSRLALAR